MILKRRQRELKEQTALVTWFYYQYPKEVLIVSANGGSRNVLEAINLKRSGVRRGVPDIFLPVATKSSAGLFIEFKPTREKGKPRARVTEEQKEMIKHLNSRDYCAVVCWGLDEAMAVITKYMLEHL